MTLARPSIHVLFLAAVALLTGCKSGVERDVVQREMRQQEDQIYALEDYLSEYQQLLCDARSENARLKQQLVQDQFRAGDSVGNTRETDTLPSPPSAPPTAPSAAEPEVDTSVVPPEVPPLDLNTPTVPPLNDQSAIEPDMVAQKQEVVPAAAEIEVISDPATAVVLRGEVQLDDKESGPRVLLHVDPVTEAGRLAEFRGRLSLLVLDPAARVKEQQLARWDFGPDELDSMAADGPGGTSFEFPLQLPFDAPQHRPLELWVRLIPEDGEKVLARTTMDLSREGQFASVEAKPKETKKRRQVVQAASAEMPVEPQRFERTRIARSSVDENGWEIAKPGDVVKSPATTPTASEWKLATRPVPETESTPMVASRPAANPSTASKNNDRYRVADAPEWAPERPASDDVEKPVEPAWSPTR